MKIFSSNGILLACFVTSAWAGTSPDALEVATKPSVVLGEKTSLAVVPPLNSFFFLRAQLHTPNGTTIPKFGFKNIYYQGAPYNETAGIDPTSNETCVSRNSWNKPGSYQAWGSDMPDSAGSKWAYSFKVEFYYSHDYSYLYRKNSTSNEDIVCISPPYITEQRKTEPHNFTVAPAPGGATTTSFPATATSGPNLFPTDVKPAGKWALSAGGSGTSFEPSSGAYSISMPYWKLSVLLMMVVPSLVL